MPLTLLPPDDGRLDLGSKPAPTGSAQLSRAERNIRWLEKFILVPDGKSVGQPLRLPEFMRDDPDRNL